MSSIYDHLRSAWTTTTTRSHAFDHTVRGAYLHYPGSGNVKLQGESDAQIAARLRGYRDMHVNQRGWLDVAYNVAVDGRGRIWELRGLFHESGANGGSSSNNEAAAILLLVGDKEVPTQAMIDGVLRVLAALKDRYSTATYVRGHQQSPDASTDCPGTPVMNLLRAGRFHYRGPGGSSKPSKPVPTTKAPAFPLPRKSGDLCYYGPVGGPVQSVSGRASNSHAGSDVYQDKSGCRGAGTRSLPMDATAPSPRRRHGTSRRSPA
jgi:hypothetical protein